MSRSTKQLSVTLPNKMAAAISAKVAAGDYASESEVVRDGLRALEARDRAIEHWLRDQVGPVYDSMAANPTRARAPADVRAALSKEHRRAAKRRT